MSHLAELRADVAPHALRRRIRVGHFGVARLEFLQLVHHEVKLLVAYSRLVKNVIPVIMFVQLLPQLQYPLFLVHRSVY